MDRFNIYNIFRLPIYNCHPMQIFDKYTIARENRVCELVSLGWERERAMLDYSSAHSDKIGIDNYIIGYLYIDFCNDCFQYRLAICRRENSSKAYKMPLYTTVKHYMRENHVNGVYDSIFENGKLKTNKEIALMIEDSVDMICENDISDAYCERESFYRLNRHLDYKTMIAEIKSVKS